MKVRTATLILVAGLLAVGCSAVPDEAAIVSPPAPERCAEPRRIVVGIDRTGSYQSFQSGRDQIASVIEWGGCPGDEIFLRWIQTNSYEPSAEILTLRLPSLRPRPTPSGLLNERRQSLADQAAWVQRAQAFGAERLRVASELRAVTVTPADGTDVFGFLAKAAEILANTPPGSLPVVIVASDLEDTRGWDTNFDLAGAAVLVVAQRRK